MMDLTKNILKKYHSSQDRILLIFKNFKSKWTLKTFKEYLKTNIIQPIKKFNN